MVAVMMVMVVGVVGVHNHHDLRLCRKGECETQ